MVKEAATSAARLDSEINEGGCDARDSLQRLLRGGLVVLVRTGVIRCSLRLILGATGLSGIVPSPLAGKQASIRVGCVTQATVETVLASSEMLAKEDGKLLVCCVVVRIPAWVIHGSLAGPESKGIKSCEVVLGPNVSAAADKRAATTTQSPPCGDGRGLANGAGTADTAVQRHFAP